MTLFGFKQMGGSRGGSVSESDLPNHWDQISNDLDIAIDTEYATGQGELLVEYPTGIFVKF